jgi:hypothetical protein
MAYENFIPQIWNEAIERELEGSYVFVEDCNRKYEGDVKKMGDSARILGTGRPTIRTISRYDDLETDKKSNAGKDIADPEEVQGKDEVMYINRISYFNYMIGDVDNAQAVNGVMDTLSKETSEALADEVDTYVAGFAVDEGVEKVNSEAVKVTKDNVLDLLDTALEKLYENDVKPSTYIVATVSPRFYTLFRRAYTVKSTDNDEYLKNGRVARYNNLVIKMSNNVKKTDDGATDNIMVRTQRAIAFAQPLTHTEAYRPEKKFADAVKGFILYDAKVVRPDEIVNLNVKYA